MCSSLLSTVPSAVPPVAEHVSVCNVSITDEAVLRWWLPGTAPDAAEVEYCNQISNHNQLVYTL